MDGQERDFPRTLRLLRTRLNMSQEDLARELGVSFSTINRWENNKAIPSKLARNQLRDFCAKMGISEPLKVKGLED